MVTLAIIPISTKSREYGQSVLLSSMFCLLTAVSALYMYLFLACKIKSINYRYTKRISSQEVSRTAIVMGTASLVGIALMYYDRVFLRGIDYSQGIRVARYQWFESQGGSMPSVLGNLLSPLSYCALYLSIYFWDELRGFYRNYGLTTGILTPILHAMINGGRSNTFTMLFFLIIFCEFRVLNRKSFFPKIPFLGLKIIGLMAFVIFTVMLVFTWSMGELDTYSFLKLSAIESGGYMEEWYTRSNDMPIFDIFTMMFHYAFHGQWHFADMLARDLAKHSSNETLLFTGINTITSRLHLTDMKVAPAFIGYQFINYPGMILFDLGWIGYFIFSIIFGCFWGIAIWLMGGNRGVFNMFGLAFSAFMFLEVMESPINDGFSLGYGNFAIFALLVLGVYIRLRYGRRLIK